MLYRAGIKKTVLLVVLTLGICFISAGTVLAMSSSSYQLPWQTVSVGGGNRSSDNYTLQDTVSQPSAIGFSESANYSLEAGYWHGVAVLTAAPALSDVLRIGDILADPPAYEGQTVEISGEYRGWEAGHGLPPVTRSDWVIQDGTGAIYVTGSNLRLRHPEDIGKPIKVTGIVRLKNGQPYIQIE